MFSSSSERDNTTSPADELFYKGKLLPLHIPPRLQMVEKLLHNSNTYDKRTNDTFDEFFSTPLANTTNTTPTSNTPFESCNISPSESCQVSREINPAEYFFEYSTDASSFIGENPKKSWTKKLKLIKQSSLGSKLKASRAYLKGLFSKSGCPEEYPASAARNMDKGSTPKANGYLKNYGNVEKKSTFGQIQKENHQLSTTVKRSFNKEKVAEDGGGRHRHRRSFSMAIKRLSTIKPSASYSSVSSSSSSSSTSNGLQELQVLKRSSSSSNSEIENSIQSAIAHCKRSQQQFYSRKTLSEVGFCSLSASKIVCEDHERQGLCRG
ncbi:hypothetical protein LguiA_023636 [Lonicera macranthoides]